MYPPTILITIGDPTGSGPELAVRTALSAEVRSRCNPVVIGSAEIIENACRRIGSSFHASIVSQDDLIAHPRSDESSVRVFACGSLSPGEYEKGKPHASAGAHTLAVARTAIRLIQDGRADGVCSGPASKVSLDLAGFPHKGLSHLFAEETRVHGFKSLLVMGRIRLLQATDHVPYRRVPELLTQDRIGDLIATLHDAMKSLFQIGRPRLAVAGLNPHAGEGGLYGNEEADVLEPAIAKARRNGIEVTGPLPADSLLPRIQAGQYDAAVSMYHDQAQIAMKALNEYAPATLLLGLPIARTSVAHGTAYGKAEAGTADPAGMIQATLLAAEVGPRLRRAKPPAENDLPRTN